MQERKVWTQSRRLTSFTRKRSCCETGEDAAPSEWTDQQCKRHGEVIQMMDADKTSSLNLAVHAARKCFTTAFSSQEWRNYREFTRCATGMIIVTRKLSISATTPTTTLRQGALRCKPTSWSYSA